MVLDEVWEHEGKDGAHIHHITDDLTAFLKAAWLDQASRTLRLRARQGVVRQPFQDLIYITGL
jgi:hypothetical protein